MSARKLARRACDGCKIRKIKCSETSPCVGCAHAGVPCTWLKQSQPRGPRNGLRHATLQQIRKAQDILQTQSTESARGGNSRSENVNDPDPPPQPSSEVSQLVLFLCIYRVQLYPIWPIIKVERLIASLQSETPDVEVYALAYALAAATATRTRSAELSIPTRDHAQILESKCQAARAKVPVGRPPNLTTVRIAIFLHLYHESLEVNSMKSMLYLREAVTIATMIGLHKEMYYQDVPVQEREIRRRVLWLLFITERVIAVLYDQPVTLRTRIDLPSTMDTDETEVLAGFRLVARLFWHLDEAGMFQALEEIDSQASPLSNGTSTNGHLHTDYSDLVQQDAAYPGYIPPVQLLDLSATRAWLQVMNLRVSSTYPAVEAGKCLDVLYTAAENFVDVLEKSSSATLEALGIALQLKASTVSAALQEYPATPQANAVSYHKYADLATRLRNTFAAKSVYFSSPSSAPNVSSIAVSLDARQQSSPVEQPSVHSTNSAAFSPSRAAVPAYLGQDYATTNNYDGLFEAVELAGVPHPDAVEDLFSHTTLEHYSTFDDSWPDISTPDAVSPHYDWQNHKIPADLD